MKAQVDWLQVMDVLLDRKAVRVSQMFDGTFHRLYPAEDLTPLRLDEIVYAYGARYTMVDGVQYIIKNNVQRQRLVLDNKAMDWFMRNVVRSDIVWNQDMVRAASRADRINWRSVCRAAREMGWYLVADGYEMDYDLRVRVCKFMADAHLNGGVALDSDLMWQMVIGRQPRGISEHDYDICIALVKSGFYGNGVE
jgi:hypothetical protein